MKKQLLFLGLLFISFTGLLNAQGVLTPEVLYYKFDGSGTSVPNYASAPPIGTANATVMGSLTQGTTTLCHGSLIGSGNASTTDYLNTGWTPNLGSGAWTISVRTSGISTSGTLYYIFGDLGTNSFRCFTNGIAGSTNWVIRGAGLTDLYINGGALSTPTMITFVYDPTLGNLKGYLNGILVSTVAQGAVNLTGTGPFKVMGYSTNVGAPAGGLIDEFRLYSHALTAAEVLELYDPFSTGAFLGADQYSCPNDTSYLDINLPFTSVVWSDATTADSMLIPGPGFYSAQVSGACGAGDDTIQFISGVTTATINPNVCTSFTGPSGTVYTTSGTYSDTALVPSIHGCDSIVTINATITPPTTSTISPTACGTYTAPSGAVYSTSGTYSDTIASAVVCDSVITINLTINTASTSTINPTACDIYTAPSGATFSSAETYMDTIPNFNGCDSVITINLTLENNSTSSMSPTTCNPTFTAPSGTIYSISGTYNDTIPNMVGCDSVITINLTINAPNLNVNQTGASGQNLNALGTGTYQWIDCGTLTPVGVTTAAFTASANGSYAVIVDNGTCSDTSACFVVAGLAIDNNTLAELVKLYPNPTTGQFYISVGAINQTFTLELINNVGQVLQTTLFTNTNIGTMEINGTSGLYFVRITKPNGEKVVLRVIKD